MQNEKSLSIFVVLTPSPSNFVSGVALLFNIPHTVL